MSFLYSAFEKIAPKFIAPPKTSQFKEKGVLTIQEFIDAGDQLVQSCQTWEWRPAINENLKKAELPADKQFLYTKVPCSKRVKQTIEQKTLIKEIEDGWTMAESEEEKNIDEAKISKQLKKIELDEDNSDNVQTKQVEETIQTEEDGFEIKITKQKPEKVAEGINQDKASSQEEATEIDTSETRIYELSITYDFFQFTPHLWMAGYTEEGIPLNENDMFEDIMDDYAKKTVTYEKHPHVGTYQLSLHPCKHASVMKNLIDLACENGGEVEPHHAMFIFLKFLSSVIPTMEYDFTLAYELGSKK